jgi:hypothetical protein
MPNKLRFSCGNIHAAKYKIWPFQVICDTYTPAGEPIPTNKRAKAAEIFSDPKVVSEVPW